ncbi:MAG: hypothetical protein ACLRMJ_03505 [Alistipes finegoldii]
MLTEDRRHGLIISLDEIYLPERIPEARLRCGRRRPDRRHGKYGEVAAYIAENNRGDDFPAFKWCRDKGEAGTFRRSTNC